MKTSKCRWVILLGIVALLLGSCGSGGRNCLVIPAQIDILQERKAAALLDLETKAKQVDRLAASLAKTRSGVEKLRAEMALLDSLLDEDSK